MPGISMVDRLDFNEILAFSSLTFGILYREEFYLEREAMF